MIKHHGHKQPEEEWVYFIIQLSSHTLFVKEVRTKIQGRSLEAGTEAEFVEKIIYCWLVSMIC